MGKCSKKKKKENQRRFCIFLQFFFPFFFFPPHPPPPPPPRSLGEEGVRHGERASAGAGCTIHTPGFVGLLWFWGWARLWTLGYGMIDTYLCTYLPTYIPLCLLILRGREIEMGIKIKSLSLCVCLVCRVVRRRVLGVSAGLDYVLYSLTNHIPPSPPYLFLFFFFWDKRGRREMRCRQRERTRPSLSPPAKKNMGIRFFFLKNLFTFYDFYFFGKRIFIAACLSSPKKSSSSSSS